MAPLRNVTSKRIVLSGCALALALALPGSALAQASTPSPLLPASPNAELIAILYWVIFFMAVVVFVLVEGLLIYSAIKFRRRDDDEIPDQVHGNTRQEIYWTVGSGVLAAAIFVAALWVMLLDRPPTAEGVSTVSVANLCFASDASPEEVAAFLSASTLTIDIAGQQWWWEMSYPDYGFWTAADMYVPVGAVVVLQMTSRDVAHAWWIPQLGGKQDVYPGATTYAWFQATKPGVYEGHCTELCGDSHAYMPMRVVAVEPSEFDAWVAERQADAPEPTTELTQLGQDLMVSKGCVGCHAVPGLANTARVGPNLDNIAARQQIAGVVDYSPEHMREWILDPTGIKPGAKMPIIGMTPAEMDALVAYLDTLR